jgi:hypothetical protein
MSRCKGLSVIIAPPSHFGVTGESIAGDPRKIWAGKGNSRRARFRAHDHFLISERKYYEDNQEK